MIESPNDDRFEDLLRSQSLGISPPDVAALMYQCGQATGREIAGRREARRRWSQVTVASVLALAAGIALDRTTLHGPPSGVASSNVATVPSTNPAPKPVPRSDATLDEVPLDPHILRASSRLGEGFELADFHSDAVRSLHAEQGLDGANLPPPPRVLDLRERWRDQLVP